MLANIMILLQRDELLHTLVFLAGFGSMGDLGNLLMMGKVGHSLAMMALAGSIANSCSTPAGEKASRDVDDTSTIPLGNDDFRDVFIGPDDEHSDFVAGV